MKKIILLITSISCWVSSFAQIDSVQVLIDSIEASLQYQQGEIHLKNGLGKLAVPGGFRYLDGQQSRYVLEDLWGNPEDTLVMGMIVPENTGVLGDNSWAFIITYDEMGYVKDDDADDIDYEELLEEMKTDASSENEFRAKEGYEPIEIIGWASKPFYDEDKKVLHWAKEIKFGENESNTLNYNVRILGRNGVMVFNAVAPMEALPQVQKSITPVLASFTYADGVKYKDFDPKLDNVAAWTIGGLVAGKVLAKAGLFALLLKYIKVIAIAIGVFGTAIWKWYKKKTELPAVRNLDDSNKA
ncbi:MAG: DUF2167 domain-containing protein [Marivirga sp.]|nr:DUF2167 domain-containing protein [Marivirga sp.]